MGHQKQAKDGSVTTPGELPGVQCPEICLDCCEAHQPTSLGQSVAPGLQGRSQTSALLKHLLCACKPATSPLPASWELSRYVVCVGGLGGCGEEWGQEDSLGDSGEALKVSRSHVLACTHSLCPENTPWRTFCSPPGHRGWGRGRWGKGRA